MDEKQSFLENRVRFRIPVKIPIQYVRVEDTKEIESLRGQITLAKDISMDGMFIKTSRDVKIGDVFRIDISLPENSKHLFAFAEVVWVNDSGAGLHLMLMSEEDREALKFYLDQIAPT